MLLFPAILFLVASIPLLTVQDVDFGWHLYLGRYISQNHQLVRTLVGYNQFSFLPLADHEWLSHLLFYPLYAAFGYWPFVLGSFLIAAGTFVLTYKTCRQQGAGTAATAVTLMICLLGYQVVYGVRLQLLLPLGAAALLYIARRVPSPSRRRWLYFFLFLIGNNLHGGFFAFAFIPALLEWRPGHWRTYLQTIGSIFLALLCNPYLLQLPALFRDYLLDSSYKGGIMEWIPVYRPPFLGLEILFPAFVFLFFLAAGRFWKTVRTADLLVIACFAYLGIVSRRFFPLFLLAAAPSFALSLQAIIPAFREKSGRWLVGGIFCFFLLVGLRNESGALQANAWPPSLLSDSEVEVINSLTPRTCPGILFNSYNLGGALLGYTNQKVFVDGRAPQLRIPNGNTLLQEETLLMKGSDLEISDALKEYRIGCLVVQQPILSHASWLDRRFSPTTAQGPRLPSYLDHHPAEWKRMYSDSLLVIFIHS